MNSIKKPILDLLTVEELNALMSDFVESLKPNNISNMTTPQHNIYMGLTWWATCIAAETHNIKCTAEEYFTGYEAYIKAYYFPKERCPVCEYLLQPTISLCEFYKIPDRDFCNGITFNYHYKQCLNTSCSYSNEKIKRMIGEKELPKNRIKIPYL